MVDLPDYLQAEIDKINQNIEEAKSLLTDPQMGPVAEEEIKRLEEEKKAIEQSTIKAVKVVDNPESPDDAYSNRNVILEIRAGVGGNEAKIWANDLMRMYMRFAQNNKWTVEILDDGVIKISGKNIYNQLKFEGGTHRVQRIPTTEKAGRIHTSTATVTVLPELKELDLYIDPEDIVFEAFRSGGHGGQNVNKVSTAVRLKHIPSGIIVTCQTQRFQAQNREIAMEMLRAKLWDMEEEKRLSELTAERKSQVDRGMRNEKIRTFNFPQGRVTDHRIGKSWHNLEAIMDGNIKEIIKTLQELS